jgi:5'-nucleotidase
MFAPIILDVDDVCLDLLTTWLEIYNEEYRDELTKEDIKSWDVHKYVRPNCGKKIYDYLQDPNLYWGVAPIEGAVDGVNFLRSIGLPIVFVTSFDPAGAKFKCLTEHGFTSNPYEYIVCYRKYLIKGSLLIDDKPQNVVEFGDGGWLFNQPHNAFFKWDKRLDGWDDIVSRFSKIVRELNERNQEE